MVTESRAHQAPAELYNQFGLTPPASTLAGTPCCIALHYHRFFTPTVSHTPLPVATDVRSPLQTACG